jgi:hypothetical protein
VRKLPAVSDQLPGPIASVSSLTTDNRQLTTATDRELQDEIIRYLTDGNLRSVEQHSFPISKQELPRAERFSRFLARRYYRDRLIRAFRYSHSLSRQINRTAEDVVESASFDGFLQQCVMGSLESARRVAEIAKAHLNEAPAPGPWWPELFEYEAAFFLQVATSEPESPSERPRRRASAILRDFGWRMPEILHLIRSRQAITEDLEAPVTLLFSRSEHGKIYVVEVDRKTSAMFSLADGIRSVEEIAATAAIPLPVTQQILGALREIGAVVG